MIRFTLCVAAFAVFAFASPAAEAQTTMFTSQAAYNFAALPLATIAFDALLPNLNSFNYYGNPGSLSVAGVTFSTSLGTELYVVGPNAVDGGGHSFNFPGDGTTTLNPEHGFPSVMTATLPAGVTAVGTRIGGFYLPAAMSISVNGGAPFLYSALAAHTGMGYVGFTVASGTISTITFGDATFDINNANMVLDDFTYGIANPNPAPEPSALCIMALGTLGIGTLMLKRRVM